MKSIHFDMVHIPIHRFVWQHLYRIEKVGFISSLSDEIGFVSSPFNEISLLTLSIEWRIYLHLLEYYLLPVFWISSFLSSINISISRSLPTPSGDESMISSVRYRWKKSYYTGLQRVGDFYFAIWSSAYCNHICAEHIVSKY